MSTADLASKPMGDIDTTSPHHERQQHGQPEKPKKLKETCDFCSLSKVKCDRGYPHCVRCIRNGFDCHYSEARRVGRTPRSYTGTGPPTANKPALKNPQRQQQQKRKRQQKRQQQKQRETHQQPQQQYAPVTGICTPRSKGFSESVSTTPFAVESKLSDYAVSPPISDDIAAALVDQVDFMTADMARGQLLSPSFSVKDAPWPSLDYGTSSSSSIPPFLDMETSNFLRGFDHRGEDAELEDLQPMHGLDAAGAVMTSASHSTHSTCSSASSPLGFDGESCLRRALSVLETLHSPSRHCSAPGSHNASLGGDITAAAFNVRSLDATLESNRRSIEAARQLLSCPCSRSWNMMLLVGVIALQVLDSYLALLELRKPCMQLPAHEPPHEIETAGGGAISREMTSMFHTPLAIGAYVLDRETGEKVIMHVLRLGIEDMAGLISILASHCTKGAQDESMCIPVQAFIGSLQTGLGEALRTISQDDNKEG